MPGKPTYDLQHLQQLVGQGPVSRVITTVAAEAAGVIGLNDEHIIQAVLQLMPQNFYKTMESEKIPGLWQDVYHLRYRGEALYIKLQIGLDGRAYVIQFKRK